MRLKRFAELYNTFGADVAFSALAASRFWRASKLKHKCILRYLKEHYADFISHYADRPSRETENNSASVIWSMWWQGTENLPEVVRLCYASFRKYCGSHPIKILTRENFRDYVTLPEYIYDKVKSGTITITHFSDIVRFYLLYNYGGLWLDSSVLITNGIPEQVFTAGYYTVKRPLTPHNRNIAQDRWTNFLHGAQKGNVLCGFVLDFFLEYWRTQEKLIDYFLIDYAIQTAYDKITECRKILDDVPLVNYDLYELERVMNHAYSPELWQSVKSSTNFSKLAWRKPGRKANLLGRETLYSRLLKDAESNGGSLL